MTEEAQQAGETPPKPRKAQMVNVYNRHRYKSFHLRKGKIGPGQTGRIPNAMYEKVKDSCTWLVRAERGDVVK